MSAEAERITLNGERSPGGVPNLTAAQYTLATDARMWPVADAVWPVLGTQNDPPALTDEQWSKLVACELWHAPSVGKSHGWRGSCRVWCLTVFAIRDAYNAELRKGGPCK